MLTGQVSVYQTPCNWFKATKFCPSRGESFGHLPIELNRAVQAGQRGMELFLQCVVASMLHGIYYVHSLEQVGKLCHLLICHNTQEDQHADES